MIVGKLFIAFILVTSGFCSLAQLKHSIYYFAIASNDYKVDSEDFINFSNLTSPTNSVKLFEKTCLQLGAIHGKCLVSSKKKIITKTLLKGTLISFLKKIKADTSKNKLLLIYYCGHGLAEIETKRLYLICGDNNYISPLFINQIIDSVDKTLKFLILLDCCFELTAQNNSLNQLDSSQASALKLSPYGFQKYGTVRLQIISSAEEQQRKIPTIFATLPGSSIIPVKPPNSLENTGVGPLARRFFLTVNELNKNPTILFRDFLRKITDSTFDQSTNKLYTLFDLSPDSRYYGLLEVRLK